MYLVYDFETTGLPDDKEPSDAPQQPHIVEGSAWLIEPEMPYLVVKKWHELIKPDGWEIPPIDDPANVHGITTEMANDYGVPEPKALENFLAIVDEATMVIAHFERFDARIARIAMKRYGMLDYADEFWRERSRYCTCNNFRRLNKLMGWKAENAKLPTAYKHFTGEDHEELAHSSEGDVEACLAVYHGLMVSEKSLDTQEEMNI